VDDGSNVLAYTSSITSWTLFAVPNFERRRYWEVVVNVSKNLAQTNMGRPREFGLDDLRERIQNMVDAELPLLVYWPDGTSSNVKLKSANFQLKSVQRRPNLVQANSEWVYTLGFMETKYGE